VKRARLLVAVACVLTATLGVAVSRAAAAAQYTVVDLGPQSTDGAADSISASGLTVGMNCATWNNGVLTPSSGSCPLLGDVNSTNESVGPWPQPSSTDTPVQAFSETPTGAAQDDFLAGPLQNEDPQLVRPTESATAIDDAGEIGGGLMSQPGGMVGLVPYGYIFDPAGPADHEVTLLPDAYDVYGLWPDWAELQTNTALALNPYASRMGLLDRENGTTTVTDLEAPVQSFSSVGANHVGSSLASDGTLDGWALSPCTPPDSTECTIYGTVIYTPTMRLPDGTEITLDVPAAYVQTGADPEAVNVGHYSVGYVQSVSAGDEAAEWNPTGQFELLNDLIPSGMGWNLQNAVAIADDGNIVGTGTLNGTPENFLLTNNSLLPTTTTGVCGPATVAPGSSTSCTFTVADTTPGSTQTPTGTVTVASDQPGAIAPTSQCTLAATSTAGDAACAVTYTPTQTGTPTLTGTYSGDGEHGSSHGTASVTVGTSVVPPPSTAKAKVSKPKTSGTSAGASVSCAGSAGSSCTVTLTLSVVETLSGHKVIAVSASKHKPKKTKRTVVLGSATVTLTAGQTKTVSVSLNATGRRLLKSRHKLSVKLAASQTGGTTSAFTVKFTAKKKKRK
jgi:hypothetical protein